MDGLVLVVDREVVERRLVSAILAADGFHVMQMAGSMEGLAAILDSKPALIILSDDIEPGPVDEIVGLMRRVSEAPILILVSGDTPEENLLDAGADYCLSRPISVTDLVVRARGLLRGRDDATPQSKGLSEASATGDVDATSAGAPTFVGDDRGGDLRVA
jgi:DNA-binding response OmpR family regulator